jgi:hypothetical protein
MVYCRPPDRLASYPCWFEAISVYICINNEYCPRGSSSPRGDMFKCEYPPDHHSYEGICDVDGYNTYGDCISIGNYWYVKPKPGVNEITTMINKALIKLLENVLPTPTPLPDIDPDCWWNLEYGYICKNKQDCPNPAITYQPTGIQPWKCVDEPDTTGMDCRCINTVYSSEKNDCIQFSKWYCRPTPTPLPFPYYLKTETDPYDDTLIQGYIKGNVSKLHSKMLITKE